MESIVHTSVTGEVGRRSPESPPPMGVAKAKAYGAPSEHPCDSRPWRYWQRKMSSRRGRAAVTAQ